jgi:predicted transcriptional regulator
VRELEQNEVALQQQLRELTEAHDELDQQCSEELERSARLLKENQKLEETIANLQVSCEV